MFGENSPNQQIKEDKLKIYNNNNEIYCKMVVGGGKTNNNHNRIWLETETPYTNTHNKKQLSISTKRIGVSFFFVIFFRHKQRRKWTKIYNWYEEREPNRHDTKQPISTIYIRWQTKNVSVFICFITAFFFSYFSYLFRSYETYLRKCLALFVIWECVRF